MRWFVVVFILAGSYGINNAQSVEFTNDPTRFIVGMNDSIKLFDPDGIKRVE